MKYEICSSTRKKCRSKRDAKKLLETSETVKSFYFCEYCTSFHVSSLKLKDKNRIDKIHSKRKISESVTRRLEYLINKK